MKTLLTILFLSLYVSLHATTYYVSTSDGNDANSGTSTGAPWKTLSKLNSVIGSLNPGDVVLLKRGDTFFGKLTPPTSASGSSSAYFTIGAYGSGNKPLLTALQTLSFSGGTGNIYTSNSFSPESNPKLLLMNGLLQQIGRWPNANAANNGYFKVSAVTPNKTSNYTDITDNSWTSHGAPINNWSGAQIAYRMNRFTFVSPVIASQSYSGSATTFRVSKYLQSPGKYGYFIENHIKCLDQNGEWCYNSNNTASIYLTSSPSGNTIQMPVYDDIFYLSGINYWNIQDLAFIGANEYGIETNSGTNINISNCEFWNCGHAGALAKNTANAVISNSYVDGALQFGIQAHSGSVTITDNTIRNTTPILGMGGGNNTGGSGLDISGSNMVVRYNHIFKSSYAGANFHDGSNILFEYNVIDTFCWGTDDGGAFYTVNQVKNFSYTNRIIRNNIIKHGENPSSLIGTFETTAQTYPIYADQWTNNVTWDKNTVLGGYTGYFSNDPINNTITNNLFYNIRANNIQFRNNHTDYAITGNVINNNVFFSTALNGSLGMNISKVTSGSISGYGTFNNNYYVRPYNSGQPFQATISGTKSTYYLPGWHSTYGFEATGALSPKTFTTSQDPISYTMLLVNETKTAQTYPLTGSWVSARNVSYSGSITLQPFTGEVLLFGSGGTPPPPPVIEPLPGTPASIKAKTKYKVVDKILP